MSRGTICGAMLALLLAVTLSLAFNVKPVKANGTIYIRADGSIDPPTADITTIDSVTYTFTSNIILDFDDSLVVEKDDIVIDGSGYTLQGIGGWTAGIDLTGRTNVTVQNTQINNFGNGIWLNSSTYNKIIGNNITEHNGAGIQLISSSNYNSIIGNNITANDFGILLASSSANNIHGNTVTGSTVPIRLHNSHNNIVSENTVTGNGGSVSLASSSGNVVSGNNITSNGGNALVLQNSFDNTVLGNNIIAHPTCGISLVDSSGNRFFHNNIINNTVQAYVYWPELVNVWDNGYPSGGNYWSDYNGTDSNGDGIGDSPYVIGAYNVDNYPLMSPYEYWGMLGDVNRDMEVDMRDISSSCNAFNSNPGHPRWNPYCDLNEDNRVDIRDIAIVCSNFGKHHP